MNDFTLVQKMYRIQYLQDKSPY